MAVDRGYAQSPMHYTVLFPPVFWRIAPNSLLVRRYVDTASCIFDMVSSSGATFGFVNRPYRGIGHHCYTDPVTYLFLGTAVLIARGGLSHSRCSTRASVTIRELSRLRGSSSFIVGALSLRFHVLQLVSDKSRVVWFDGLWMLLHLLVSSCCAAISRAWRAGSLEMTGVSQKP